MGIRPGIAACVHASLREDIDMLGRYGGEEFILFLDQVDGAGAQRIAERIRSNIERCRCCIIRRGYLAASGPATGYLV